jgi:hypothetical protein
VSAEGASRGGGAAQATAAPGWRARPILARFCSEAVASMAAALAFAIEWTIESRVNRLLGDFIQKMVGA